MTNQIQICRFNQGTQLECYKRWESGKENTLLQAEIPGNRRIKIWVQKRLWETLNKFVATAL